MILLAIAITLASVLFHWLSCYLVPRLRKNQVKMLKLHFGVLNTIHRRLGVITVVFITTVSVFMTWLLLLIAPVYCVVAFNMILQVWNWIKIWNYKDPIIEMMARDPFFVSRLRVVANESKD